MKTELTVQNTALVEHQPQGNTYLQLIAAAVSDERVSPEKLQALFTLKQAVDADEARKEFSRAFAQMAAEMPRVRKDGTISKGDKGSIPFATWDNVDKVIRPILQKHGFSLRFATRMADGAEVMTAVLSHVGGHSESSETRVKPDPGPGRNDTQAWGSGRSYTKRYLTLDLLNIVTVKEDDDGRASGAISEDQANNIHDLIAETEMPDARRKAFLKMFGVADVAAIQHYDYDKAVALLKQEIALKRAGVKR